MKIKQLVLYFALAVLVMGCHSPSAQGQKTYLEAQDLTGTVWQMDYSMEIHDDTVMHHVPEHWLRIKSFSRHRFSFTGYDFRVKEIAGMGGGTYNLKDSVYTENIEFHHRSDFIGTQFTGKLYFDSLFLYQEGKVGELHLQERWHRID